MPSAPLSEVPMRVTAFLLAIDSGDWRGVQDALAPEIRVDYSSLFENEPRVQTADELVAGWKDLLPGFDATQHLTGPILVQQDGEYALARCAVTATHMIGKVNWTVGGHYEMTLEERAGSWRIAAISFHRVFVHGDQDLPRQAKERAAAMAEANR